MIKDAIEGYLEVAKEMDVRGKYYAT